MSEVKERTFLVGIFGDNFEHRKLLGQALGAPGTSSDIQFYNRFDPKLGHIFTTLTPIDYPEKLKPFLQTLIITDIHILIIDIEMGLNASIGEILVGLDLFHENFNSRVIIALSGINSKTEWKLNDVKTKIETVLKETSLQEIELIEIRHKDDYNLLKELITELRSDKLQIESKDSEYAKVLIDHAFSVKGIGTVILGIVKKGAIHSSQLLEFTGNNSVPKKIIIRSIQKHDRIFKDAFEGDRVGLALKGNISPQEISRDNIIVTQGIFKNEKEIIADVYINPFYKPKNGSIIPGDSTQYNGIAELKVSPLNVVEGEVLTPGNSGRVKLRFDKPLYHDGKGLHGILCDLTRFENKLRIIGNFKQII